MYAQLLMLQAQGMTIPLEGRDPKMPPIAWHDSRSRFPGDTVADAIQKCKDHFGAAPRIVFVNLPSRTIDLYQVGLGHWCCMPAYTCAVVGPAACDSRSRHLAGQVQWGCMSKRPHFVLSPYT